jgi:hypothetical protein
MGGEEDHFATTDLVAERVDFGSGLGGGEGLEESVDDGVTGDVDGVIRDLFEDEGAAVVLGGGEVEGGDLGDEAAIHFLWEGAQRVA